MVAFTFRAYRGRAQHRFTCPSCGKEGRVRTFIAEKTVNPFNKDDDGFPKSASQVQRDAQRAAELDREQFAREPLCATCEDSLSYADRRALRARRAA